jgi:predicted DNA-binding transcriptional regulator AlpA
VSRHPRMRYLVLLRASLTVPIYCDLEITMEALFYTVPEFCDAARISRSHFYALQRRNEGPRVARVGDRTLVRVDDVKEWVESVTAAAGSREPSEPPFRVMR